MAGRRTRNRGRDPDTGMWLARALISEKSPQVRAAPVVGAEPATRPDKPIPGASGVIATNARPARRPGVCGMCGWRIMAGERIADVADLGECHVWPCITEAAAGA